MTHSKDHLVELVYTSRSISTLDEHDVQEILKGAYAKNKELGITGVLVYYNQQFMQLIEGCSNAINPLFQSICHDARHYDIKLVSYTELEQRSYNDWEMGYVDPKTVSNSFLSEIELNKIRQGDYRKIIKAFAELIKN
ncbi:BLUF domain-containing protein [Aliikangiella marina]|uniref:BLUF domain-containing protein n=1 Tax=Aliikangiella marina TaxID=1712262 RepID=A0A545T4X2_9GAMM|nr:BLUF domain-containing protein [Aliikangiella marina]TQV72297.1 BLUF domain-containing protein [Aliikangiella marina]